MSNGDDEERGWLDEWRDDWEVQKEHESWTNPDAPEGWNTWSGHNDGLSYNPDQGGSHWHWETEHWATHEEALSHAQNMMDDPSSYIDGGTGNIAEWTVMYDEVNDEWYLEVDAYVEY